MDPVFISVMSVIAMCAGVLTGWHPLARYRNKIPVGPFGFVLAFLAVILITTFKVGDVVLDIEGTKLELKQARAENAQLHHELAASDNALGAVINASRSTNQSQATDTLASLISKNLAGSSAQPKLHNALDVGLKEAGLKLVPQNYIDTAITRRSDSGFNQLLQGGAWGGEDKGTPNSK